MVNTAQFNSILNGYLIEGAMFFPAIGGIIRPKTIEYNAEIISQ